MWIYLTDRRQWLNLAVIWTIDEYSNPEETVLYFPDDSMIRIKDPAERSAIHDALGKNMVGRD